MNVDEKRARVLARLEARHGTIQQPCDRDTPTIEAAGVAGLLFCFILFKVSVYAKLLYTLQAAIQMQLHSMLYLILYIKNSLHYNHVLTK
jgi:hypothetical protein